MNRLRNNSGKFFFKIFNRLVLLLRRKPSDAATLRAGLYLETFNYISVLINPVQTLEYCNDWIRWHPRWCLAGSSD